MRSIAWWRFAFLPRCSGRRQDHGVTRTAWARRIPHLSRHHFIRHRPQFDKNLAVAANLHRGLCGAIAFLVVAILVSFFPHSGKAAEVAFKTPALETPKSPNAARTTGATKSPQQDVAVPGKAKAEDLEFFEQQIRPLLTSICSKCHVKGEDSEGGLKLDTRQHMLEGGDRGPAIVPGDVEHSLMVQAVHRTDDDLAMPPEEKLTADQVAAIEHWIQVGAPWSQDAPITRATAYWDGEITAEQRRYWAFQPLADVQPPEVSDKAWPISPIDNFLLAQLEARGLKPAQSADRQTLLRRVTFDLIGLPPTPEEINAFLADDSPDAWARVVDRLLDSPHYGERWGRHWLDLVRFAETNGLDNDYAKPNAWRYRDYVIEAFNDDVPYDQLIREHIAGDLLPQPRISHDGLRLQSPIATGQFWFGEMLNVPVDRQATLARELENRIDVLGKAFLGLTIACARCHDHRFDPIRQEDYYALAGFLDSSTNVQACVDSPAARRHSAEAARQIAELNRKIERLENRREVQAALTSSRLEEAAKISAYLMATRDVLRKSEDTPSRKAIEAAASKHDLPPDRLSRWVEAVAEAASRNDPVLFAWNQLLDAGEKRFDRRARALAARLRKWNEQIAASLDGEPFADFEGPDWGGWTPAGEAFTEGPSHLAPPDTSGWRGSGFASSYRGSDAFTGRLTSPRFKVEKQHLTFLMSGGNEPGRISVNVILNSQVLHEPEDVVTTGNGELRMVRKQFNLEAYRGEEIFLEIVDESPDSHVVVDHLTFTDTLPPPDDWVRTNEQVIGSLDHAPSPQAVAERIGRKIIAALTSWQQRLDHAGETADHAGANNNAGGRANRNDPATEELLRWAINRRSLLAAEGGIDRFAEGASRKRLATLRRQKREIEKNLSPSTLAIVSRDVGSINEPLQIQGNPHHLGDIIPRRFPQALTTEDPPNIQAGSGRLLLADWIASAKNPLSARVMVNRIWQHHFGTGLVATVDNFGRLGEEPSHPKLLDFLARRFIDSGWSIKAMHRLMLVSRAYQQSSRASAKAIEIDPGNRLLHHMPHRRLEAECIRDELLAISGQLDPQLFGSSKPVHLTPFMEGEDLPEISGPLDGGRRRSIYLEVRRNHITPLLATFDFPKPQTTVGRRTASLLPSQALALLNDEFVIQQATAWARRLLKPRQPDDARIRRMYREAFCRSPDEGELARCRMFLDRQRQTYRRQGVSHPEIEQLCWADLCHVLFNLEEFIFIH